MSEVTYKGVRTITKTKYHEFEQQLNAEFQEETTNKILDILKNVLHLDPNVSVYNEKMKENIMRRRTKLKEQGISTYVSSGAKSFYDKKKANQTT